MDVMEAPSTAPAAFDAYMSQRRQALIAITPDAHGSATYITAAGQRIDFTLFHKQPTVLAINGIPVKPLATAGGVIDADGQGHATIKGPGGPIQIDFSDWANPKRTVPQPDPGVVVK